MWLYSSYLKGASRGMQGTSGVFCENVLYMFMLGCVLPQQWQRE